MKYIYIKKERERERERESVCVCVINFSRSSQGIFRIYTCSKKYLLRAFISEIVPDIETTKEWKMSQIYLASVPSCFTARANEAVV
jgi:hypothetical protein